MPRGDPVADGNRSTFARRAPSGPSSFDGLRVWSADLLGHGVLGAVAASALEPLRYRSTLDESGFALGACALVVTASWIASAAAAARRAEALANDDVCPRFPRRFGFPLRALPVPLLAAALAALPLAAWSAVAGIGYAFADSLLASVPGAAIFGALTAGTALLALYFTVVLAARFSLAIPLVCCEPQGPLAAPRIAWSLGRGRTREAFAAYLLAGLPLLAIAATIAAVSPPPALRALLVGIAASAIPATSGALYVAWRRANDRFTERELKSIFG
jgi:hypothetical protein